MNTVITDVSKQWISRAQEERFTSLYDMLGAQEHIMDRSRSVVRSNRQLTAMPTADGAGIEIFGSNGHGYAPTHWAFQQLATLAEAPAGYLRKLPAPMAADCLNFGLHVARSVDETGLLISLANNTPTLRAATGPTYGRIWNADIVRTLTKFVGDGVSGDWRVPAPFNGDLRNNVTKENTTLFASDRDMFIFLADEDHKIEVKGRRNGETGLMSRGMIISNSEVGSATFRIAGFTYDYMCSNRMIWGVDGFREVKIRHTAGAPDRWAEELMPTLKAYANSSSASITQAINAAQDARIDKVAEFLAGRFGPRMVAPLQAIHQAEEGKPIETVWDAATAVTAYAKGIEFQDERTLLEAEAGKLMRLAA
jgi:hypothetical protein